MAVTNKQNPVKMEDAARLEFYRLIGEGYKDMYEGRTIPIEEVKKMVEERRKQRG